MLEKHQDTISIGYALRPVISNYYNDNGGPFSSERINNFNRFNLCFVLENKFLNANLFGLTRKENDKNQPFLEFD